jgi:hypothetical protein
MGLQLDEAPATRKKNSLPGTVGTKRIGIDLGIAAGLAACVESSYYFMTWASSDPHVILWLFVLLSVTVVLFGGMFLGASVFCALLAGAAWWVRVLRPRPPRQVPRWVVPLSAAFVFVLVGLAAWRVGPQVATAAAFVLPAAIVWFCGIGLAVLAYRKHEPYDGEAGLGDVLLVPAITLGVVALFQPGIVTADPVALPLFPVALWLCVRIWRAMSAAGNGLARAAADVTAAVIAGSVLVATVVWVATMASLSAPIVAAVRGVLTLGASWSNVPWWVWPTAFCALAAAGTARLRRLGGGAGRVTRGARRLTVGVHIVLMMSVLVGRSTPAALGQTLAGQLRARYVVAWQRHFDASYEAAAYQRIREAVSTPGPGRNAARAGLQAILADGPDPVKAGSSTASSDELAYAALLGQEEAGRLDSGREDDAGTTTAEEDEAVGRAGLDGPIDEQAALSQRVGILDTEEAAAGAASTTAGDDAEDAATAIADLGPASDDDAADEVVGAYLSNMLDEDPEADDSIGSAPSLTAPSVGEDESDEPLDPGDAAVRQATSDEETQISNHEQDGDYGDDDDDDDDGD